MEFARSTEDIFVSQQKYILDLLGETSLMGCNATETPTKPNLKLQPAKTLRCDKSGVAPEVCWKAYLLIPYTS